jgi:hypothetical protein
MGADKGGFATALPRLLVSGVCCAAVLSRAAAKVARPADLTDGSDGTTLAEKAEREAGEIIIRTLRRIRKDIPNEPCPIFATSLALNQVLTIRQTKIPLLIAVAIHAPSPTP